MWQQRAVPAEAPQFACVVVPKPGLIGNLNRVPKCDVTKILFLENCTFGLKF